MMGKFKRMTDSKNVGLTIHWGGKTVTCVICDKDISN